jgi:hypothetical protein
MQLRCEAEHTEEQILIEMDSSLKIDLVPGALMKPAVSCQKADTML